MLRIDIDILFIEIDNTFYCNHFVNYKENEQYYKIIHRKIKNIFTPKLYLNEKNYSDYLEFKNSVYIYYLFNIGKLKDIIKTLKINLIEVDNTEKLFEIINKLFKDK